MKKSKYNKFFKKIAKKISNFYYDVYYFIRNINFFFSFYKNNKYVKYERNHNALPIDKKIYPFDFSFSYYDLNLVSKAFEKAENAVEDIDYILEYESAHRVIIHFKNEKLHDEIYKKYTGFMDIIRKVLDTTDLSHNKFDDFLSKAINPKNSDYIKIIPYEDNIEELITTVIKFYKDNGYYITNNIFNSNLFVADDYKTCIKIYAENESAAAQISFLIQTKNLAEILHE